VTLQPRLQRSAIALYGLVIAVKNAQLTAPLAAFFQRRLSGRLRPGIFGRIR
jgi:hypothetical protein